MHHRQRVSAVLAAFCALASFPLAFSAQGATPAKTQEASVRLRFIDEAAKRGVEQIGVNSTGPTFGDYDNDGDIDVYVPVEDLGPGLADRLFENDGKGFFRDVAEARGVQNLGSFSRGASWGDYDNDGDIDLLVANMPPGQSRQRHVPTTLFRNLLRETKQPNFENVTVIAKIFRKGNENDVKIGGIGDTGAGVAWADYDNDGDLDFYWKNADEKLESALFRNNGDGTFTDVTEEAKVTTQDKLAETNAQGAPSWTDVDEDGWIDLLVTHERTANILFRNKGDGTFEDVTRARKPPSGIPFLNPGNAQGACIADYDNDGDQDVYLPHADQKNRLIFSRLRESGQATFQDVTLKAGAGDMGGARGCTMGDFDNDGDIDLYVNNGGPTNVLINDVITDFPPFVQFYIAWEKGRNALLLNDGKGNFTDVTAGSGAEGLGIGSGVGSADLDGDGFLDIFATNRTYYAAGEMVSPEPGRNFLLMNQGNANNWIKVKLEGVHSNRNAFGARIKVTAGDLVQYHESTSALGYNSTNDPVIVFGLGARTRVDSIEIVWPRGVTQVVKNPKIKSTVRIRERTGTTR